MGLGFLPGLVTGPGEEFRRPGLPLKQGLRFDRPQGTGATAPRTTRTSRQVSPSKAAMTPTQTAEISTLPRADRCW